MVGRRGRGTRPQSLTVHQIVAYNFRRARESKGWTQAQTGEMLEQHLGTRLNQAGVSAIEKTYDSDRRRNIDVAEVVAFASCFGKPISWFFLPPPGSGEMALEPVMGDEYSIAADLVTWAIGGPMGWDSFLARISELLQTDTDTVWGSMQNAFAGVKRGTWEGQIDLRRQALQQTTLARFASPGDEVITSMAALLVELVKSTPLGFQKLRHADPDEALAMLAEGDELVRPMIELARQRKADGLRSEGGFDDVEEIDLDEALGREPEVS